MEEDNGVLVIEDDQDIRASIIEVLESEGYLVQSSENGQEGLDALRKNGFKPKVIILDLMMPVLDGWGFRTQQLLDPLIAAIPVVIVTADGNAKSKARSLNAAAGIRKPIEIEEFLKTIKKF